MYLDVRTYLLRIQPYWTDALAPLGLNSDTNEEIKSRDCMRFIERDLYTIPRVRSEKVESRN